MKKVLSIFLALAMLISLIPAVFAADTETEAGIKVVYDFYNADLAVLASGAEFALNQLSYAASKGFWQYADNSDDSRTYVKTNGGTGFRADSGNIKVVAGKTSPAHWVAFKINVPKQGKYNLELAVKNTSTNNTVTKNLDVNSYIFEADGTINIEDLLVVGNTYNLSAKCTIRNATNTLDLGERDLAEGEHYFVFRPYDASGTSTPFVHLYTLTLTEGDGLQSVPMISSLTPTANEDGTTTVTATAAKMSNGDPATDVTFSYAVAADDEDKAEIINGNVVKGKVNDTVTIIATATASEEKGGLSSSKSIEVAVTAPVTEPTVTPEYEEAFGEDTYETTPGVTFDALAVHALAYATDGTDIKPANIKATDNENGTYTVTTDAEVNGYTFRYWAKGLQSKERKRIVSFDASFTYTPSNESNYLIAVYDKAGTEPATTEYYNANGQKLANGDELPYMAGYGQATGWKEPVYGIKEAIYGEPIKYNITIGDAEPVKYAWGDPVVCPKQTTPEGQTFWGWKKTVNNVDVGIVSTDPEYTFYAWEDCTVTPVFGVGTPVFDGEKRRIILGTFLLGGKTAVMAEFFGFDNAVERGITIDGTDYAMTKKNAKQFTIVDDDNKGNISGYAILGNVKYVYNYSVDDTAE